MMQTDDNTGRIVAIFKDQAELDSLSHLFEGFCNATLVKSGSEEFRETVSPKHGEPALITVTAPLYPDDEPGLVAALRRLYPMAEILLMTVASDTLPQLNQLAKDRVRHLLVAPNETSGDCSTLQLAVARLAANKPWHLDNCVKAGTEIMAFHLQSAADKEGLITRLVKTISGEEPEYELLRQRAALLADEMLENALYGAPQDQYGNKLFSKGEDRIVYAEEGILFRFAFDGVTLAMEIVDGWGTLHPDMVVDFLARNQEAAPLDELEAGGRGLFIIWRFMDHLHINIKPGQRTVLGGHLKAVADFDPEAPRSFFISSGI